MIKKIFVDMDDVLVDFNDHYESCFGRRWNEIETVEDRWKPLNENPQWYATIPIKKDAVVLMNYLYNTFSRSAIPVKILTATGYKWVEVGVAKQEWVNKHLGVGMYDMLTVVHGKDKHHFAQDGSLLIDDMVRNVEPWINVGGLGIVYESAEKTIAKIEQWLEVI